MMLDAKSWGGFCATWVLFPKPMPKPAKGASHPDRNTQFEHINALVKEFQAEGQPAISVDTKKKELVGDFKNNGRTLRPKGTPNPSASTTL